ncbi:DUF397 domain-containing protein [Micromonospora siamensis]|uniref:DUF397 domain-containing protein n=1 Tax=Micromonospora siamensis TaxID=299152 RepID=A0A1C5HS55_9ACTN|nr:DUF397 domain-containing protein [Micromonospora siamensis]SCG48778.1 protein of unknown function [Micromonospora siamensis]
MDSQWRKSSRSGSNGACVEARHVQPAVEVRDSKDADGPILRFSGDAWSTFVTGLKR